MISKTLFAFLLLGLIFCANDEDTFDINTCTIVTANQRYTYDFSAIKDRTFTFDTRDDFGTVIYLRLCSHEPTCDGDMAACAIAGTNNHGLGTYTTYRASEFTKHDSAIFSAENGDKIDGQPTSFSVSVGCDESTDGTIVTAYQVPNSGSYYIHMVSKYACPKSESVGWHMDKCSYYTEDETFNLSSLMGVLITYQDTLFKNEFAINTCSPCMVNGQSVCLFTYDGNKVGAGAMNSLTVTPYKKHIIGSEEIGLVFEYDNGDICSNKPRRTQITYICDSTAEHKVTSVYQGNCVYFITIKSKYACSS
jgi:hypothetical protein